VPEDLPVHFEFHPGLRPTSDAPSGSTANRDAREIICVLTGGQCIWKDVCMHAVSVGLWLKILGRAEAQSPELNPFWRVIRVVQNNGKVAVLEVHKTQQTASNLHMEEKKKKKKTKRWLELMVDFR